ncbi:FtsK/SpoIIIE domain-containing protein [Arthrobacter sulfonylureivorans]|uniref:FtsK/SpoIIIE domain-containing protein n=1 Tax=Arthrobacter sulfonylureivorans TaxID=2486855 RepID=UPI0039E658D8
MVLHLTLAAAPGIPAAAAAWIAGNAEAVCGLQAGSSAAPLDAWLRGRLAGVAFTVAGHSLASLTAGAHPLVDGAVVVCAPEDASFPRRDTAPLPPLVLAVTAGPDAGRLFGLQRGTFTIGRHACAVTIADPSLSRLHATLDVTDRQVLLRDAGSANGIICGGKRTRQVALASGCSVWIGNSQLRLVVGSDPGEPFRPDAELSDPVPVAEKRPEPRTTMTLLLAGLPLIAGVALALLTGMWFFLVFSAMSLLAAAVPYAAGRRQRRRYRAAVAAAAEADARRRRLAAPDAAALTLSLLRCGAPVRSPTARPREHQPRPDHVWIRLGTASLPAHIGSAEAPVAEPPLLENVPVCVDLLAEHGLKFEGTAAGLGGMLRSALLQLAARAGGSALQVVCYAMPEPIRSSARFLPGVGLAERPGQLAELLSAGSGGAVLLVAGRHAEAARVLADCAAPAAVLWFGGPAGPAPRIVVAGTESLLTREGPSVRFAADLASTVVLDRFARRAAAVFGGGAQATGSVPASCRLQALLPPEPLAQRWSRGDRSPGLAAMLGAGAGGPLALDLAVHGPHLLVAGTTGSGKSELLRSLVLSLALARSPDAVNFLLLDFKGGSGLGPLVRLPHCAGLLTDLTLEAVNRALAWLQAEVRRRETLLAGLGVSDVADCTPGSLPRLVVVVDEFRMLGEDAPQALPELMRVATVGRALGIHLVLATQRPQGAVSSDIRANVTAMIALRTQNAAESRDLLDSPAAAEIPVTARGRAFLRIGTGDAMPFQSASSTLPVPGSDALFRTVDEWLRAEDVPAPDDPHGAGQLEQLVAEAASAATRLGLAGARQLLPALPAELAVSDLSGDRFPRDAGGSIAIGLLDLPSRQRQELLRWLPERDGHLAILGVDGGGHREFLRALAAQVLGSPAERHCYVLDGDGSLGPVCGAARTGAYVGPEDVERAARVLRRLAGEVSSRLGALAAAPDPGGPAAGVPLVLLVSGSGRWLGGFRSGRLGWAEDCLQDIARDGPATGVALAVTGERELASSRFLPLLANRLHLPAGAGAETLMSWPRLPPMEPVPGRALVLGRIGGEGGVCQLITGAAGAPPRAGTRIRPFRVEALPRSVPAGTLPRVREGHPVIGVEGDELEPSTLPLPAGEVYLVLGPEGSGKTNLLALLRRALDGVRPCSVPPDGADADGFWSCHSPVARGTVLLVDDAAGLGARAQESIAALVAGGASAVVATCPGPMLLQQVPLALQARAGGRGMVLAPRAAADAEFFGVRLDDGWRPPGRAYRIGSGRVVPLQVALAKGRAERRL